MSGGIKSDSAFSLIANTSLALSNWALLIILSKTFSAEQLGQVVLSLSICAPIFLLISLNLRTLLVVDVTWDYSLSTYWQARMLVGGAAVVIAYCLFRLAPSAIEPIYFLIILLYKYIDSLSEFIHAYYRRTSYFKLSAVIVSLKSIFSISLLLLGGFSSFELNYVLTIWLLNAITFTGLEYILFKKLIAKHDSESLPINILATKSVKAIFGLFVRYRTLAVSAVISALFFNVPNYFLASHISIESAGYFATLSYFMVAGAIVINSISQSCSPRLARFFVNDKRAEFTQLVRLMCLSGLVIGASAIIFSWLFGSWLLRFVYNESIADYHLELVIIMAAAALRYCYIFIGTAMSSMKEFRLQTRIYTAGIITLTLSCFLLVPTLNLLGASLAMLIAVSVEMICYFVLINRTVISCFEKREKSCQ
ncbi:hypothetical protein IC617_13820 [Neiella sp. HB171785]|uniref:Oligosaccharide flippase family protein n=1 Tax=Neiella litorisoli TaxID=2771431 RepID=A0A8J6UJE8_9GAMM|nr:hypothetical protein [Neiella litorisoli]MBD1390513.1 hypothetical protein [Neiella litorisoli]